MPAAPPAAPHWSTLPLPRGQRAEPLARCWLAGQLGRPAEALVITRSAHGRPMLGAPAGFDCNWSHSGDLLALALGRDMQVGIDIERVRPRPKALELARRWFTDGEADWLASLEPAAIGHAFLRLWCAKEAVLKAHGRGLAFGLERLAFTEATGRLHMATCDDGLGTPGQWSLLELQPASGYLGMLAWRVAPPAATARHTASR